MAEAPKMTIAFYRGYTHGEFAIAKEAPIGGFIGNWCRNNLADKEFLPKGWSWDPIRRCRIFNSYSHWKVKKLFCSYDYKASRLHVPVNFCEAIKHEIEYWGAEVKELPIPAYPIRELGLEMNPKFTDRPEQVEPIQKCSEPTPGIRCLSLQTGKGKTYSAIKSAVNLNCVTIIIVPGLVDQWIDEICKYTNAKKGSPDVYKIEGFETFSFLAKNPTYRPKFFVASTRTMQMFANCDAGYELLPWNYTKFFAEYGIGTKIIDECHKQFHANTLMDLLVNVPHNIYLSATFDQTSKHARDIFNVIFPKEALIGGEVYEKYVTVYFVNFYGEVIEKRCVRSKGYMHSLYEGELMKSTLRLDSHINNVYIPLLNQYYINSYKKGDKCLIFCSTVEYVEEVVKRLRKAYPNLKINSYIASSSRSILESSDMVVSTIGKASTGLDWKGLHCCLNTVSVRSPVLTSQMLGRLRKINGENLAYIDLCDKNLSAQCRHAEDRKRDLSRMAAKFYDMEGVADLNYAVVG